MEKIIFRTVVAVLAVAVILAGVATSFWREASVTRDDLLLSQSKSLSDFSRQATDNSNAGVGMLLALEALPDKKSADGYLRDRPYWAPAEFALEKARRALREERVLAGHDGYIASIAVTADGSRVVTGSSDKAARIWDAASGRELARLTGLEDPVWSVAVTPDGSRVVTVSSDNTARIWRLFPFGRELIDEAKRGVPRCLTATEREQYYLPPTPPRWCYEMRKWPYDAVTLMIDGETLLAEKKLDEARSKFVEARKQDPALAAEIDALLKRAAKDSEL